MSGLTPVGYVRVTSEIDREDEPEPSIIWKTMEVTWNFFATIFSTNKRAVGLPPLYHLADGSGLALNGDLKPEVAWVNRDSFFVSDSPGPSISISIDRPLETVSAGGELETSGTAVSIDVPRLEGNGSAIEADLLHLQAGGLERVADQNHDADELRVTGDGLLRAEISRAGGSDQVLLGDQRPAALLQEERERSQAQEAAKS